MNRKVTGKINQKEKKELNKKSPQSS